MKVGRMLLSAACLGVSLLAANAKDANDGLWLRNRKLTQEAESLRRQVNGMADDCRRRESAAETLRTTAAVLLGQRKPPQRAEELVPVLELEPGEGRVLRRDGDAGKAVVEQWLSQVRPGVRYRFSAEIRTEDVKGCESVKFGGLVKFASDRLDWPGALVGAGTFDWRPVSFDYTMSHGGSFCLLYGIEKGTGCMWIRNVRVSEVRETWR